MERISIYLYTCIFSSLKPPSPRKSKTFSSPHYPIYFENPAVPIITAASELGILEHILILSFPQKVQSFFSPQHPIYFEKLAASIIISSSGLGILEHILIALAGCEQKADFSMFGSTVYQPICVCLSQSFTIFLPSYVLAHLAFGEASLPDRVLPTPVFVV